jgi:hypothetical protein
MSDGVLIAIATIFAAAIAVGGPAGLTALAARRTAEHTAKTADAVGTKNGSGDLITMTARLLNDVADVRAEQAEVKAKLEARTHVLREGETEPVELGPYMQSWFHGLNTHLQAIRGILHVLWSKLGDDYDLPPLPAMPEMPTLKESK